MTNVYWWRGQPYDAPDPVQENWGDRLAGFLLFSLGVDFQWSPPEQADLVCIGSVLEHLPKDWAGIVVGAGKLFPDSKVDLSHAKVAALRGKLTRAGVTGVPGDVVLGDTGLLVPRYLRRLPAQYDVGVLPHWSDKHLWQRFKHGHFIDPNQPPWKVIQEIGRCRRLITSSLHGLVVADAYGVPRRAELFPRVGKEGGDFKYRDYCSIYDTHPHFGEFWTAPYEVVQRTQDRLYDAFALALGHEPLPDFVPDPKIEIRRNKRCPQISLLVPFRDDGEHRTKVWEWLRKYWLDNLHSVEIIQGHDGGWPFCADTETEILTTTGWKPYSKVRVGDLALTLNHETSLSEWQPVEAVNVFDVTDEPMLKSEGQSHSSLTTMNHRWPVIRRSWESSRKRRAGRKPSGRCWTTSGQLTTDDKVPISAQCAHLPVEAKYTDAFVETVAWAWTEGTFGNVTYRVGGARKIPYGIRITQSEVANPEKCERIRAALTVLAGPPVDHLDGTGTQWREYLDQDIRRFYLGSELGKAIRAVAPDRVPSFEFLLSLTRAQLALFIEVSILADGTSGSCGSSLAQKDPKAAEAFQFACILAGHATSIREVRMPEAKRAKYGYDMTNVHLRTAARTAPKGQQVCETVNYTGKVWCPTTGNSTWLARRNGTVYFTGNSKSRAINHAARRARGRVFVVLDADTYLDAHVVQRCADNIEKAVRHGKHLWYVPYDHLYRINHEATMGLLDTNPHLPYSVSSPPPESWLEHGPGPYGVDPSGGRARDHGHEYGALIQMMPREAFFKVGGWESRISGWGSEDVSALMALDTLYGQHEVTRNDVLHLWHARLGTNWETRKWVGQTHTPANSRLAQRYQAASGEPGYMEQLVGEHRQPEPTFCTKVAMVRCRICHAVGFCRH